MTEAACSEWQHRKTPLLIRFPFLFPPLRLPVNLLCEIQRCLSASLALLPSPEMGCLMRTQLIFTELDCDGEVGSVVKLSHFEKSESE